MVICAALLNLLIAIRQDMKLICDSKNTFLVH